MADEGVCRGCGAKIVWQKMQSGRANPCDPAVLAVVTEEGAVVRGGISHFGTCPKAKEFRGTGAKP